jgi:hypothetical protein
MQHDHAVASPRMQRMRAPAETSERLPQTPSLILSGAIVAMSVSPTDVGGPMRSSATTNRPRSACRANKRRSLAPGSTRR